MRSSVEMLRISSCPATSGKFCRAKALAMLWSSVQHMASAMASTPRQFAAVSCFSEEENKRGPHIYKRSQHRGDEALAKLSVLYIWEAPEKGPCLRRSGEKQQNKSIELRAAGWDAVLQIRMARWSSSLVPLSHIWRYLTKRVQRSTFLTRQQSFFVSGEPYFTPQEPNMSLTLVPWWMNLSLDCQSECFLKSLFLIQIWKA